MFADVATEKAQKAVIKGVEGFSKEELRQTKTEEKTILPSPDGR